MVNPFRYRGYYYDNETGLYFLQTRYYDPQVKRFLNADSLFIAGDEVTGANMYAYCNGNPVMLWDPSGREADPLFGFDPIILLTILQPVLILFGELVSKFPSVWIGMLFEMIAKSYSEMKIDTDGSEDLIGDKPEWHNDKTAYSLDGEYMDPKRVRYVVLPRGMYDAGLVSKGDAALVFDWKELKYVWAIVGDIGDSDSYHEVSASVAWDLGYIDADGQHSAYGSFTTVYFPGTKWFIGASTIADLEKFFGWVSWRGREPILG